MTWLISILLAGVVFTSEDKLQLEKQPRYVSSAAPASVRMDETEQFEQTYPLNPTGKINVSNINGSITVQAWDRNEVKVTAVKVADSREALGDVEIKVDARPDYLEIRTDYQKWKSGGEKWRDHRKLSVQYNLIVPRGAVLKEIETVNGSVTVSDMVNYTKISAVNGGVKAMNLSGTAILDTVNGTVEADFNALQPASRISLNTVNGQVKLLLPSDANAVVKADTVNGSIDNNFGLPVRKGQYVGRDMYGRIGTGETQIKLSSVNGGLTISRKNDGRSQNPAVNLLPQKNNDDLDWDGDGDSGRTSVKSKKVNREVSAALKKSHQEVAKAKAEAEREMKKIQPIIAEAISESIKLSAEVTGEALKGEMRERLKEAQLRMSEARMFDTAPVVEKKSDSFPVKGTPKVVIEAPDCTVTVRGWDEAEVKYTVTKVSRGRNFVPVTLDAKKDGDNVYIKVEGTEAEGFFQETGPVRVEVYLPKKSHLRLLTDREIRLENVTGEIELRGGDGAINVRDAGGDMLISSGDGRIRVIGFDGALDAKSVDGELNLEGTFAKLSAQTVDGAIIFTVPADANINIESNRKNVLADNVLLDHLGDSGSVSNWKMNRGGETYKLYSVDGRIVVRAVDNLTAGK